MILNSARINWDNFRYFLALVDQKTLSGAARVLNVTHATMARRINQLEEEIGTVLFDQGPSGFQLTEKGQTICELIFEMRDQICTVQALAENEEPEGLVRISATPFLCNEMVTRCFPGFRKRCPHIALEVVAEDHSVSLARQEAHLSLRLARPEVGDFTMRRVVKMDFGLFKSDTLEVDESVAPTIQYVEHLSHLPEAQWMATHYGKRRTALQTNSLFCQKAAIEQGMGIGLLPVYAARRSSDLKPVATEHELPSREVWLAMGRTLGDVIRVRMLADYLVEYFKSQRATYEA